MHNLGMNWTGYILTGLSCSLFACGDPEVVDPLPTSNTSSSAAATVGSTTASASSAASSSATGVPVGDCQRITALDTTVLVGGFGGYGIDARVDLPLLGYARTRLNLELYEEDRPQMPGVFELSVEPDDNYGTCQHCVLLVAFDAADRPRRAFFQSEGTMTLSKVDASTGLPIFAGATQDVRLVEVTQSEEDFSWSVVPNGLCFDLEAWEFDTTPVDGIPCEQAEDCGNELSQVCDLESNTCVAPQCVLFDGPFCPAGQRCLPQLGPLVTRAEASIFAGACYVDCVPGAGGCAPEETCFPIGFAQDVGICLEKGTTQVGAPCSLSDVGTGCVEGAICADEPPICRQICEYLAADVSCPFDSYCTAKNLCRPLEFGDIASVGAECSTSSPPLAECGPEGESFRGLCLSLFANEPAVCQRICRTDLDDCPSSEVCVGIFENPLAGICHRVGECGDGQLDLLGGELCDDGNTVAGDGCSPDCKVVELGPLCTLAEPLSLGGLQFGSNEAGPTGYASNCDPFVAVPTKTYSYLPPGPGELQLTVQSAKDITLSVLGRCDDNASELGCSAQPSGDTERLTVNFAQAPSQPVLVVVRGGSPNETGVFSLASNFAPAVCGDGHANGAEACDDGNTVGGDGCTADCLAIEWDNVCMMLPVLPLGSVVMAEVPTTGPDYFDSSQAPCAAFTGGGREKAYRFVAPASGKLQLSMVSQADLVLYVEDGCGPVTEMNLLSCINSPSQGQPLMMEVAMNAGQNVTVVVEGFVVGAAGPFTLNASFSP